MRRSITGIVCTGTRNCSERIFDNGFPIILPFNADLLSKNGSIKSIQDLPLHLNFSVNGTIKRYELLAVTFGSETHFISAIKNVITNFESKVVGIYMIESWKRKETRNRFTTSSSSTKYTTQL